MTMKGLKRILWLVAIPGIFALVVAGCGGGGGGDGGGGETTPTGIYYTGPTSPATIDENNAEHLSTSAYQGGSTGTAVGGLGAIQAEDQRQIGRPRTLDLAQTLKDVALQVDVTAPPGVVVGGAIQTESGQITGDCPGNPGVASYTIQYDDVTGDFSGSLEFNSYCSEGVTMSGSASFSGRVDVPTLEFLQFSFSYDNITVSSASDSYTAQGDITFNFAGNTVTLTMNMLMRDDTTMKVYWINDFNMTLNDWGSYIDFEMSGTSYDPDYGYVTMSTISPFRIYYGDYWPSDGILVITGNTAIAGGSSMARLSALSRTTYEVDADTTGDGAYDWESGLLYWADL